MRLFRRRGEGASTLDLLVVGLGNPGREYERTRHNVGWRVVDELARRHGGSFRSKFSGKLAELRLGEGGERVALLKPETYMNESGRSVGPAAATADRSPITCFPSSSPRSTSKRSSGAPPMRSRRLRARVSMPRRSASTRRAWRNAALSRRAALLAPRRRPKSPQCRKALGL